MIKRMGRLMLMVGLLALVWMGIEQNSRAEPSASHHVFLPLVQHRPSSLAAYRLLILSDMNGDMQLYTLRGNGTGLQRLSDLPAKNPVWSPDGTQILFASPHASGDDLYLVNNDGSDLRAVTTLPGDEYRAEWSPDGRSILFLHDEHTTNTIDLYLLPLDAPAPQFLDRSTMLKDAHWSPKGNAIAYTADVTATAAVQYHLFVYDVANAQRRQLTEGDVGYTFEGWLQSGKQLLIGSDYPDDRRNLYTIQPDGNDLQPFVTTPGIETVHAISADGEQVAYSQHMMNSSGAMLYQKDSSSDTSYPLSIPFCALPTCGLEKVSFADGTPQVAYVIWDAISINFSPSQLWLTARDAPTPPPNASLHDVYSPFWLNDHTLVVHRNASGAKAYTRTPYIYDVQTGGEVPLLPPEESHSTVYDVRYLP